ncbi:efflux RND transporter permease subunit [Wukongibacter baidiensis]|uniref:efflux RND transporter permease subunit n=1 Tax=Wukongibacter baidiensis TaxID=1723361 RepID=UPI003D7FD875
MKISNLSIKRPVALISMVIIMILFGIVGLTALSVDLFPPMSISKISVKTTYSGAGPKEVEELVTKVIEKEVSSVSNLEDLTSYSYEGYSQILLEFTDGTDLDIAGNDVREKLDSISNKLPDDASNPIIKKADPNAQPIIRIAVAASKSSDLEELKKDIEDKIVTPLQRIDGVASIDLVGYREKEIEVILNQEKLYGYDLSINNVIQVLKTQNISMPIGNFERGTEKLSLKVEGEFEDLEEIRNLPVHTDFSVIKLKDIATVEEKYKDTDSYAFANGNPCITVSIKKQSDANTVELASKINKELSRVQRENPDMSIIINKDDSTTINSSIDSVINAGVIGGALAIAILFIFLQNFRSTVIIGVAIPISIVITFAFMYFFTVGINMISLMGLALGIGMLVDNAIVVLENIYRYRANGFSIAEAAMKGVSEVGMAIVASTLTSIAVFFPIVFMDGFAAQIFRDMSLTVTFSLIASLLVALTLVPMMCSKLLKNGAKKNKVNIISKIFSKWNNLFVVMEKKYRKILEIALNHRFKTTIISFIILATTLLLFPKLGMEFMPEMDEGTFKVDVNLPNGIVVEETLKIVEEVEQKLKNIEEIQKLYIEVDENTASLEGYIGEVSERERSVNQVVEEVRRAIKGIPGAEFSVNSVSLGSKASGGGDKPLTIQVTGNDYDKLEEISRDISRMVKNVPGTREVTTSLGDGSEVGVIRINRDRASNYGLTISSIASELRSVVNGNTPSSYKINDDEADIKIIYDNSEINSLQIVKSLPISSANGTKIPLSEVASITKEQSPSEIKRVNQTRVVTIDAALSGIDLNTAKKAIENSLSEYNMPDEYSYQFGGNVSSMQESFTSLGGVLIISIVLIYFIMSAQFESFFYPFIIMFSVPYAMTGGVFALFVSGTSLSIVGLIGFIMLVGIVVNNAIVLIEYTNQLRDSGYDRNEALLKAGPIRLKPILMTTMTTVLGMLPMAIGIGQGAEMQAPLARVIVGGLTLSTFVTLIIVPINYAILDDILKRTKKKSNTVGEK